MPNGDFYKSAAASHYVKKRLTANHKNRIYFGKLLFNSVAQNVDSTDRQMGTLNIFSICCAEDYDSDFTDIDGVFIDIQKVLWSWFSAFLAAKLCFFTPTIIMELSKVEVEKIRHFFMYGKTQNDFVLVHTCPMCNVTCLCTVIIYCKYGSISFCSYVMYEHSIFVVCYSVCIHSTQNAIYYYGKYYMMRYSVCVIRKHHACWV